MHCSRDVICAMWCINGACKSTDHRCLTFRMLVFAFNKFLYFLKFWTVLESLFDELVNQNQVCCTYLNAFLMTIPNMVIKFLNLSIFEKVLDPLSAHACRMVSVYT